MKNLETPQNRFWFETKETIVKKIEKMLSDYVKVFAFVDKQSEGYRWIIKAYAAAIPLSQPETFSYNEELGVIDSVDNVPLIPYNYNGIYSLVSEEGCVTRVSL